ncbi:MAG TPA: signal peptide peptidase SppA [Tepidisphaeraceae bacterium]|nr:signal peptide peptidase SppA [Tepidisphaeraceae bacterium]
MIRTIIAAVFICSVTVLAKPPTTRPLNAPATRPTTNPTTKGAFPSAREMAAKLLGQHEKQKDLLKVAHINLDKALAEKPAAFSLFGDDTLTLQSVISRLQAVRDDKDVRAVLITMGDTSFNLAQAQEIRDQLIQIRKAGKRAFIYADAYDTAAYIAATGATDVCMMEGGEIMIPGVGLETMFAKGLLDKVGVKADYVQIGQYKGADEQFTREFASDEMKGELNKILDSLYEQIVEGISYHRNISKNDVTDLINGVFVNGTVARDRKLVDHLLDEDGLRELLKKELGRDINIIHEYGVAEREQLDLSSPFALLGALTRKPPESHKPAIALVFAEGVIVDGEAEDNIFGGGGQIGSEDFRKAMRMASRDENVEAIVLRIDSPGGSAMASEVMWQAARRVAKDKPVIVSIGSMAASGGYYLASAGDYVFADPSAIVGSIGVVGGKFVFKDLFDKVGLHTESFSRGKNAELFSSNQPFTDQQRRLVTNWMTRTYEQFTDRVMSQRGKKIKDIDEVAHGRIFLAKQARGLGMVDELGGIDKAIQYAATQAELEPNQYEVKIVPGTRTLADLLRGGGLGSDAVMPFKPQVNVGEANLLNVLSPSAARLVRQQIQYIQLLQQRPVILVSPFVMTFK